MKKVAFVLALLFVVLIAVGSWGVRAAPHVITGPNEPASRGAMVTFTVDQPRGSLFLTCQQNGMQVLSKTHNLNTAFLLDSSTWRAGPATCHVVWYVGGIARGELDFAVPDGPTSPPPGYTPIVLVVFENRSYSALAGQAPYLNGLAAQGRLFTNYLAITHPSLPNYMAFTTGSTLGCTTDYNCTPNTLNVENFYHQLELAGISWNSYVEYMTTNCGLSDTGTKPNNYIAHHHPVVYFTNVHAACQTKALPYSGINPANLARFTFISPSNAHNMHDGTVAQGDAWAATNLPALVNAGAKVIVTFDEGCCNQGQLVYTFVVGPGIAPSVDARSYNTYSLLAGLEALFGLPKLLNAQTANALPLG